MLTGAEIIRLRDDGVLTIDPFDRKLVNPNSYNLRLCPKRLLWVLPNVYADKLGREQHPNAHWLNDPERPANVIEVPKYRSEPSGREYWLIQPGQVYLASTEARFGSKVKVAGIATRSSYARGGISSHLTAGFGDLHFEGQWTLEITTMIRNTVLWCDAVPCQGYFMSPEGQISIPYAGKYYDQRGVQPCLLHEENRGAESKRW